MLRLAILAALLATAAQAQTYVPGQAQQRLNDTQLQMQAQQLQQLQRQNAGALSQPDPGARMQALQRQQQIQQQAQDNLALRQQMQAPPFDPANLNARIQANGAAIQQLQQTPPPAPQP